MIGRASVSLLAFIVASEAATARAQDATPKRPAIEAVDGVPVTFTSRGASTAIFLAHGDVSLDTVPDPFEPVGVAPVTIKLAPGTYTVETASAIASTGHERFSVEAGAPLTVDVRPGNATVKGLGTLFTGLGVISLLLGVTAIVAISSNDKNYDRFGIGIPLLVAGAATAGVGVGMTVIGTTTIHAPHLPPGGAVNASRPTSWGASILWRF